MYIEGMARKPITKPTPAQLKAQAAASLKVLDARARRQFLAYLETVDQKVRLQAAEHPASYPGKDAGGAA